MNIVEQIKKQREDSGLSQWDVSLKLGYKSNKIYLIESGKSKVSVDDLDAMNKVLGWEFEIKTSN